MAKFDRQPQLPVTPKYDKVSLISTTSMLVSGLMVRHSYEIVDSDKIIDKCIELAKRVHDRIDADLAGKITQDKR
jgi:hypothetical protein